MYENPLLTLLHFLLSFPIDFLPTSSDKSSERPGSPATPRHARLATHIPTVDNTPPEADPVVAADKQSAVLLEEEGTGLRNNPPHRAQVMVYHLEAARPSSEVVVLVVEGEEAARG